MVQVAARLSLYAESASGISSKTAAMETRTQHTKAAGTSRLTLRPRKARKEKCPASISCASCRVMMKPEMTKNMSTPMKPPGSAEGQA